MPASDADVVLFGSQAGHCRDVPSLFMESVTVADPASRKYPINTYGKGAYVNARYRVRTCDPYRVKVVLYH
jgi:hypothetical protein